MNFMDAVKSVYSNYVGFQGRARRSEYWWWFLFYVIVYGVLYAVDMSVFGYPMLAGLFALGSLIPAIAVGVRRLHDTGRSGWWILIGLVPLVGFIVLLIFYVMDSQPGVNQHGPNPRVL
ncbi:DUF805 domain-containing protein [Glycocaulis abyssi]|uniref:DUF805 domain-containing protein n=1 Tax=Glycocaulis abyssi TaxID=1433403 RepID=A0ABV9NBW2_9PROT